MFDSKFLKGKTMKIADLALDASMPKSKRPNGYVIYRGASMINGDPIVVIAITKSSNKKTGNMVQTYILPDNGQLPVANAKALNDEAVCGDCKHRRGKDGSCYVNLGQGVTVVTKAYLAGKYPHLLSYHGDLFEGRNVRLGTYGDPAAVPTLVWEIMLSKANAWTGYTHQWHKSSTDPRLMQYCMASVDSDDEFLQAQSMGYRTFRVRLSNQPLLAKEFMCPASEEAGKRKLCTDCKACDGGIDTAKASPAIVVHGTLKSRFIPVRAI
jgi:hypothetical protein